MTEYYVSTTGSDSYNGESKSKPFKTINKAIEKTTGGDSINIKGGTYDPCSIKNISGNSNDYINMIGYDGTVTITNKKYSNSGRCLTTNQTKYWNIIKMAFTKVNHPIYLENSTTNHLNFHHCDFHDYEGPPTIAKGSCDHGFYDCKFHHIGVGTNNLFNIMAMPTRVKNVIFNNCEWYDTQVHGSLNFGHHDSEMHENIQVLNCHFYDNKGGDHIYTNDVPLKGCTFKNNLIETGFVGGIRIRGIDNYIGYNTIQLMGYYNSSGQAKGCGPLFFLWPESDIWKNDSSNNTIEHNIIKNNTGAAANFGGVDGYNIDNTILRSNIVSGQNVSYRFHGGTHTFYDLYDNDTVKLYEGSAYIRCTNKERFKITATGHLCTIRSLTQHTNYSEIHVSTKGYGTFKIDRTGTPPDPTPTITPTPLITPDPSTCPDPIAEFTYFPFTPKPFELISVDGSTSYPGLNEYIKMYTWYVDNVRKSQGKQAKFSIGSTGWHDLKLVIQNDCNNEDSKTKSIEVKEDEFPINFISNPTNATIRKL